MSAQTRNIYADLLKGSLIFLVVFGHVIQYGGYPHSLSYRGDWLWSLIYMFHMPLFIGITGYFTAFSIAKYSIKDYLTQRFRLLLVPLLIWSAITAVLVWIFGADLQGNFSFLLISKIRTGYWFVWAIILFSLLISVMHYLKLDKTIILILLSFSILLPITFFPLSIIKDMTPFFVAGYLFPRFKYKQEVYNFLIKYTWLFILLSAGYYFLLTADSLKFNPVIVSVIRLSSKFVLSITFMLIVYWVYKYSTTSKLLLFISKVGKETLGIYLIQGVIFTVFEACCSLFIPRHLHLISILLALVLTVSIFFLTQWIARNESLGSLLLGKKLTKG